MPKNQTTPSNGAILMTPKEAAEYTDRKLPTIKKALNDPRYALIFTDDAVKITNFPGYDPIIQITKDALDAWLEATAKTRRGPGTRAPRGMGRIHKQRIPDARKDAFVALVTGAGFEAPFLPTPRKSKKATTNEAPSAPAETAPTPTFEHELVEA